MGWFMMLVYGVIGWLVLGKLWKNVIKPYFRKEINVIRTSVLQPELAHANKLDDQECCICLVQPKNYRVAVTCGHSFCADCIFKIYAKKNYEQIECPYCRSNIISIFKAFNEKEPAAKIEEIRLQIREYNSKFGDDRSIKRTIKELPFVLTKIVDYIFSFKFLLFFIKNAIFLKGTIFVIIYFMLPTDIMPTATFGVAGYIDNAAVLTAVGLFTIGKISLDFLKSKE